ncbi:kinase-like protein [Lentinus tigrinus ALCF2SS1-7]|uniref:kinase-like protein n=1 Tax=Lentinus tigrinus ALCF2SS1-7 TaxID=1328758 RepID=UPI001165F244|nr:kinase-like protein [Lentinus tigrinus ALCF2SS1-7]
MASQNVLSLLDDFTFTGPNGAHKVHITEVIMPLKKLYSLLPACAKKQVATDLARGLAHVHRCGFIHGDIHIGCAMPPAFTENTIALTMSLLDRYDATMVIPRDPALRSCSLPPYLLDPCDILRVYRYYGGLKARQDAKLLDFGNARRVGEEDADVVRWMCPPPEAAFAYYGCGGLEILPTTKGDIWCLGALMLRLFTNEAILYDSTSIILIQQAELEGVIPPAWRAFWDRNEILRSNTDQVTPEKAEAGWSRRRDQFSQKNPEVDLAEADLLIALMRRMLATNPDVRPSIDEVLAHPWFAEDKANWS